MNKYIQRRNVPSPPVLFSPAEKENHPYTLLSHMLPDPMESTKERQGRKPQEKCKTSPNAKRAPSSFLRPSLSWCICLFFFFPVPSCPANGGRRRKET